MDAGAFPAQLQRPERVVEKLAVSACRGRNSGFWVRIGVILTDSHCSAALRIRDARQRGTGSGYVVGGNPAWANAQPHGGPRCYYTQEFIRRYNAAATVRAVWRPSNRGAGVIATASTDGPSSASQWGGRAKGRRRGNRTCQGLSSSCTAFRCASPCSSLAMRRVAAGHAGTAARNPIARRLRGGRVVAGPRRAGCPEAVARSIAFTKHIDKERLLSYATGYGSNLDRFGIGEGSGGKGGQ